MTDAVELRDVADIAARAEDLEGLVRPLLEVLAKVARLETTYLSIYDRRDDAQLWRFVYNASSVQLPEGVAWPWTETLCHRMILSDRTTIDDVGAEYPEHAAHKFLGVRGFVSIPYSLVGRDGEIAGTLCGGTLEPLDVDDDVLHIFELFASLIADRLGREIELGRERVRADLAERRLEERTRLIASAEHTLKSPLTIVQGWSTMLDDRYPDFSEDQRRDAVARIRTAADDMASRVDALLDEAQTAILGTDLRPAPIDLPSYLADVTTGFDGATQDLTITVGPLDGVARVDIRALDQIVGNLVENAIKYAAGGTATVSSCILDDTEHPTVQIVVEDDGPGIDETIDLFEAFQRGPDVTGLPGSGLGLHIVKALVEASGGTVAAANREDGGARFSVRLPAA